MYKIYKDGVIVDLDQEFVAFECHYLKSQQKILLQEFAGVHQQIVALFEA